MDVKIIINLLCSVCLAYLGYSLAMKKFKLERRHNMLVKRYEEAYYPFVLSLFRGFNIEAPPKKLDFDTAVYYLDMLSKNLHLWNEQVVRLYPKYYKLYLDLQESHFNNPKQEAKYAREIALVFTDICLLILEESTTIAKEISLPPISQVLLSNYCQTNQHILQHHQRIGKQ